MNRGDSDRIQAVHLDALLPPLSTASLTLFPALCSPSLPPLLTKTSLSPGHYHHATSQHVSWPLVSTPYRSSIRPSTTQILLLPRLPSNDKRAPILYLSNTSYWSALLFAHIPVHGLLRKRNASATLVYEK